MFLNAKVQVSLCLYLSQLALSAWQALGATNSRKWAWLRVEPWPQKSPNPLPWGVSQQPAWTVHVQALQLGCQVRPVADFWADFLKYRCLLAPEQCFRDTGVELRVCLPASAAVFIKPLLPYSFIWHIFFFLRDIFIQMERIPGRWYFKDLLLDLLRMQSRSEVCWKQPWACVLQLGTVMWAEKNI